MLGRRPSPPDSRDFNLADYLGTDEPTAPQEGVDPLGDALSKLLNSHTVAADVKPWAKLITAAVKGNVTPSPTPQPANTDVIWKILPRLDQGQTPHCVGFGWADWGNSDPINDTYQNSDGDAIYYECKVIDGEPNQEDGSDVRSGAKAMQARKRLTAYAFATSVADAEKWVKTRGPVVVGTDWTNDMFNPVNGFVVPTGGIAGGHCYLWSGVLDSEDAYLFTNSWGSAWSLEGQFKMKKADFAKLFASQGEACAAVELPI